MTHDLRDILGDWNYEPGKISVRKIIGRDGHEKIQTRIDLGVLQMEAAGRPDGTRPMNADSLLQYWEERRDKHVREHGSEKGFRVPAGACEELRHEGHLVYQRYLSLFVLEDFEAVERDTGWTLRLLDFCRAHGAKRRDRHALEEQRPYVLMMNTRAAVYRLMRQRNFSQAAKRVRQAIRAIEKLAEAHGERPELNVLRTLEGEVWQRMPCDAPARITHDLQDAIEREDYETAAALRDRLTKVRNGPAA